jgi:hypothetical protein
MQLSGSQHVGSGSFSTEGLRPLRGLMSAVAPIAIKILRRRDWSRRARNGRSRCMHKGRKQSEGRCLFICVALPACFLPS